jgi:Mn-dependent DtxR family transcriptional regulator
MPIENTISGVTYKNHTNPFLFERRTAVYLFQKFGPEFKKHDYFQALSWLLHFDKPTSKELLKNMQEAGLVRIERYKIVLCLQEVQNG